jgi:hypothetical protein
MNRRKMAILWSKKMNRSSVGWARTYKHELGSGGVARAAGGPPVLHSWIGISRRASCGSPLQRLNHRHLIALLFAMLVAQATQAQSFEFAVRHRHLLRDCRGTLKISAAGVEYQTEHSNDARKWKFKEIQTIEVNSPARISLVTYEDQKRYAGKDRIFEFELLSEKARPELTAFLLEHVRRPMILAVLPEAEKPAFEIPVKHLHTITGAAGNLKIYPDRVVFQSAREGDSRIWRLADIERFSQPDRFRFQIVGRVPKAGGPTEAYNFQLMEDLPPGVYDYLWVRLHPSSYYPEVRSEASPARP